MLIDSKRLWDDNGYGEDNPFGNTVTFLIKEAANKEISSCVTETVIAEVLLEVANGKTFSKTKCPCGCGIDKSGTAITHEMLKRIFLLGDKVKEEKEKIIMANLNSIILGHIKTQNEQYTNENIKPKKAFFDWSKSPTLKGGRWISGLVRSSK